uniref:Uncharacterized protein n=1 Tax=Lutzomyia longipalpis TaxID=7200 RepID=A0A1B0CA96_LUTLO
MEVYEFTKTYEERYHEIQRVFQKKDNPIPASRVRLEFLIYLEKFFNIPEWQALWKIPRFRCEKMNLKFPSNILGLVSSVDFTTGIGKFSPCVDDLPENEELEEEYNVPIEQLWVSMEQDDPKFKADEAAEAIDAFRYFLTYIWLPWDAQESDHVDYFGKFVLMRLQMLCDMKTGKIRRSTAAHIREHLVETRRLSEIRDIVQEDEPSEELPKVEILVKINAQLNLLQAKLTMLQDASLREIYEAAHLDIPDKYDFIIVTESQDRLSDILGHVGNIDSGRFCNTLQNALMSSNASDRIYIGSGKHTIGFREYFNSSGSICGVKKLENVPERTEGGLKPQDVPIVCSEMQDHFLFVCNGEFTFENILFDCSNVKYGFICQDQAKLTLRNCIIRGNMRQSECGIDLKGRGSAILENCLIIDCFYGIGMKSGTKVDLIGTDIVRCEYGIFLEDDCDVTLENSNFRECTNFGIYLENVKCNGEIDEREFSDLADLQCLPGFQISGNCAGNALIEAEKMDV